MARALAFRSVAFTVTNAFARPTRDYVASKMTPRRSLRRRSWPVSGSGSDLDIWVELCALTLYDTYVIGRASRQR
jgi:hypothetical protein